MTNFIDLSIDQAEGSSIKEIDFFKAFGENQCVRLDNDLLIASNLFDDGSHPIVETAPRIYNDEPLRMGNRLTLIVFEGTLEIEVNLESMRLVAGDALSIHKEGSIVKRVAGSSNCRMALLVYPKDGGRVRTFFSVQVSCYNQLQENVVTHIDPASEGKLLRRLRNTIREIYEVLQDETFEFKREVVIGYFTILFAYAMQKHRERATSPAETGGMAILQRFTELVSRNVCKERSVKWYADKMCFTPKYLSQTVKKASGKSASDWIREYAILEAKFLLRRGDYSVGQVAYHMNFPNPSFFGKYFKNSTGVTPKDYARGVEPKEEV